MRDVVEIWLSEDGLKSNKGDEQTMRNMTDMSNLHNVHNLQNVLTSLDKMVDI